MAYATDKKPGELTALTSLATDDVFVVGDTSDASEVAKYITKANLITDLTTSFAPALGADDNYVTDAEKAALHAAVTVADSAEIDLTLTGQQISASIVASSIDETKLDASVNASLDLADTSVQPSTSPLLTTVELGHASDTTLSRVSAGVVAVEGVTVPTISSTSTLTNKRVNPRTASSTTSATLTPDLSSANVYYRTTQTEALTIGAPTGTPVIGETLLIYVDSAGAQTLTMNATYKVFGAAFPATTTAGKTLMISAQYNGTDWKTLWANAV